MNETSTEVLSDQTSEINSQQGWFRRHWPISGFGFAILAIIIFITLFVVTHKKHSFNYFYAKDWRHVYYVTSCNNLFGWSCTYSLIPHADKSTFQVIPLPNDQNGKVESEYAKDKNYVYLDGEVVPNADPRTFEVLEGGYSHDSKNYYFEHTDETGNYNNLFVKHLTVVSNYKGNTSVKSYGKWQVFPDRLVYKGKIIKELDASTFKKFNNSYFEDKNYLVWTAYDEDEPLLIKKDPGNEFQLIENQDYDLKDNLKVVIEGRVLENANPATFTFLKSKSGIKFDRIGVDGKNVYFRWERIPWADAATFTYIACSPSYYKDKNYVYYDNASQLVVLKYGDRNLDPATFKSNGGVSGYVADKTGVYLNVSGPLKPVDQDPSKFQNDTCQWY